MDCLTSPFCCRLVRDDDVFERVDEAELGVFEFDVDVELFGLDFDWLTLLFVLTDSLPLLLLT